MSKQTSNTAFSFSITVILGLIGLIFCLNACNSNANTTSANAITAAKAADTTAQSPELYIDLEKELKTHPKRAETVAVMDDGFFKTAKTFMGINLKDFIDSMVSANSFDTTGALVVFECKDGYKPVMDIAKVMNSRMGYIVYKDLSQKKAWADSIAAAFTPYYVTWTKVKHNDHDYMWPYGLIGIRLKASATEFAAIYPYHNAELVKGFQLYRNNCMKCHAVNKIGGTMGPEMNTPKNITDYWTEENIIAFAKSPTSFRNNSPMPAITGLTDAELHDIVGYLKGMKGHH